MSKNKLAKFAEVAQMPHVLEYPFARLQQESFPLKGVWNKSFFKNEHPIVVELGCGKGEYTVGLAGDEVNKNFIGMDVKGARIWSGAKISQEKGMTNVAFVRGEIEMLNAFFAENEVDEIWITFPVPQMKKVNKRLTSSRFLNLYRHVMKKGGIIHLKTDSPFLYTYTRALVTLNRFKVMADTDDLYAGNNMEKYGVPNIQTFYEKQWLSRGLTIKYLSFVLPSEGEIEEPDIEIEYDTYRSTGRNTNALKIDEK